MPPAHRRVVVVSVVLVVLGACVAWDRLHAARLERDGHRHDAPPSMLSRRESMAEAGIEHQVDEDRVVFERRADVGKQRAMFRRLRELRDELNVKGHRLDVLSMGMSGDFEAAIAEGATHVRIGTAIFGARPVSRKRQT